MQTQGKLKETQANTLVGSFRKFSRGGAHCGRRERGAFAGAAKGRLPGPFEALPGKASRRLHGRGRVRRVVS